MQDLETIQRVNTAACLKHQAEKIEKTDLLNSLIDYEMGDLTPKATIELFQGLIDNNMITGLQGHYGRMAKQLIDNGLCTAGVSEEEYNKGLKEAKND